VSRMKGHFARLLGMGALLLAGASGCAGADAAPADAQSTVVSLERIDCSDCGDQIVSDLRARPGIYKASFDKQRTEILVVSSRAFDVFTTVKKLAADQGFEAILGAGKGHYVPPPQFPPGADVQVVAENGADVPDLGRLAVKGKVTVVDFSAIWCRTCRAVDEHMVQVLGARKDVAYRKLEIGDWDTPLSQRYLRKVPQLPYVVVLDASGAQVKEIVGVDLGALDAAIAPR
jgi:thiol-disulfide isomerase/thioredoxin